MFRFKSHDREYSCVDWIVLKNSEILLADKIKTKTYIAASCTRNNMAKVTKFESKLLYRLDKG